MAYDKNKHLMPISDEVLVIYMANSWRVSPYFMKEDKHYFFCTKEEAEKALHRILFQQARIQKIVDFWDETIEDINIREGGA